MLRHGANRKGALGGGRACTARGQDAPRPSALADDGRVPKAVGRGGWANREGRHLFRAKKRKLGVERPRVSMAGRRLIGGRAPAIRVPPTAPFQSPLAYC